MTGQEVVYPLPPIRGEDRFGESHVLHEPVSMRENGYVAAESVVATVIVTPGIVLPMLFIGAIIAAVIAVLHLPFFMPFVAAVIVILPIVARVDIAVPGVSDEKHRTPTGVVLVAITPPTPLLPGLDMEVNGRRPLTITRWLDQHGAMINHLRRRSSAEIELPEEPGFAQLNRDTDVRPLRRSCETGHEGHAYPNSSC